MDFSLSSSLVGSAVLGQLDSDALAYISAVTATGATVTKVQRSAINDFIKAEKAAARWTPIKRLFLPIWGSAAANAIDMKIRATGIYVGGVTHAAGYVQGNGSTGYMSMGTSPSAQGLTASSSFIFALVRQAESRTGANFSIMSAANVTSRNSIAHIIYNNQSALFSSSVASYLTSPDNMNRAGIFYGGSTANNARYFRARRTAGVQSIGSNTTTDNTSASTSTMYVMAANSAGTTVEYSNARIGAVGMGMALSTANADAFSLALKTLWETCTGLTLP